MLDCLVEALSQEVITALAGHIGKIGKAAMHSCPAA
jgi:hypothetical protein